jgi:hypothetical protein
MGRSQVWNYRLKMKILVYLFGIAALVFGLLTFYFWDMCRDQELKTNLAESQSVLRIKEADARTAKRDTAIARLQFKMDSASRYYHKEESRLKSNVMSLKHRERVSRGTDTVTLTLTDTVYMAYDSLVASLTTERNGIKADCKALTDSLISNIDDLKGIRVELEGQVQRRNEALSKEKKKGKWLKAAIIVLGGVIVYEEIKD